MGELPWILQIPPDVKVNDELYRMLGQVAPLLPGDSGLLVVPVRWNGIINQRDVLWRAAQEASRDEVKQLLRDDPDPEAVWYLAGDLARMALGERLRRQVGSA